MKEPNFRIVAKATLGPNARKIDPPRYQCQAPGCQETSDNIACQRHLNMLPIDLQGALTRALATRETGLYGTAMSEALTYWKLTDGGFSVE